MSPEVGGGSTPEERTGGVVFTGTGGVLEGVVGGVPLLPPVDFELLFEWLRLRWGACVSLLLTNSSNFLTRARAELDLIGGGDVE